VEPETPAGNVPIVASSAAKAGIAGSSEPPMMPALLCSMRRREISKFGPRPIVLFFMVDFLPEKGTFYRDVKRDHWSRHIRV
jgi:hypothetical protein